MKEFLDKISTYNLFNYLLPGTIFVVIMSKISSLQLIQKDIILGAFVYYFIGLVISRFGSLIIEPFLKYIAFLKFAEYKKFVVASKKDEKIEVFSEANNTYRTIVAMLLIVVLIKFYDLLETQFTWLRIFDPYLLITLLLILFLFSYRKQTEYITKRIEANT